MAADATSADSYAALQARIDAARQRLADAQKMEWAEIGSILEGISHDIEEAESHSQEKRDETHARANAKLDDIHRTLDGES